MRNIAGTECMVVQQCNARLRRMPGNMLCKFAALFVCRVRDHSVGTNGILEQGMRCNGVKAQKADLLYPLQEWVSLGAHPDGVDEEFGKRVLKDRKLFFVIQRPATFREGKDIVCQMRTAKKIVVSNDHGQLAALHDAERFEEPPCCSKISGIGIAREISGDDNVVGIFSERVFQRSSEPRQMLRMIL